LAAAIFFSLKSDSFFQGEGQVPTLECLMLTGVSRFTIVGCLQIKESGSDFSIHFNPYHGKPTHPAGPIVVASFDLVKAGWDMPFEEIRYGSSPDILPGSIRAKKPPGGENS
jgi:hypothetical protein